jgi:phosphopantothenate synthetase
VFDTMLYNSISNTVAADVIDYLTSENASPNAQRAASAAAASLRQAAVRFGG